MDIGSSNSPILVETLNLDDVRRSIKYHPSIWGEYFLAYASTEISAVEEEELQKQKQVMRNVLTQTPDDSSHKLELIDAIQRLGVGYHFKEEIDISLRCMNDTYLDCSSKDNDIRAIALRFRLLRQQGYYVSCDVFNKFIDNEGNFKESLVKNVAGMLELYEAAHFRIRGEEILDKALEFSASRLESLRPRIMSSSLFALVNEALKFPILKNLTRFGARKFISIYQEDESHNKILLNFAKLDFNLVQKIHQKELSDLTRWWKDLDFKNKLPFVRDRMVECYFWALGIYFEPQYNIARKILSKVIVLASSIDDIYDVYGTLDELQLFTHAIQRWDKCALEQLPPYMKICYKALLDVYAEMEELDDVLYRVNRAKEEMQNLVEAYFEEAKWLYNNHIPTIEEYMNVAVTSSGYIMVAATSLVGMENLVAKEDFDWVAREAVIVRASAIIARLMDDMAGHGFEKKISAVECYMTQYGASQEEAFDELKKQVSKAWKDINQECLIPTVVSVPILMRILNSARVIHLLYSDGDGYTKTNTMIEDLIRSVLIEPTTI
ncbi:Beta-caryophyllene synthase [Sesamum alatum]|uniref:Beta-caryophyllene synthase n=1 Tax=Sesamum alatum TaxID=300844 RepID=A0AAE1Z046_9LAMI|nr:Beta-caryophyllene synthase [Sesamum alatum]